MTDAFNPTEEHAALRRTMRDFVEREVEPQAAEHDRTETLNLALFRELGELGLLGITVPETLRRRRHGRGRGRDRPRGARRVRSRASPSPTSRTRCCS